MGRTALHTENARPVPPGALYEVKIEAPEAVGWMPFEGSLVAGEEHTVTLEALPNGPRSFTSVFVFEDEFGPIVDEEQLRQIILTVRNDLGENRTRTRTFSNGRWRSRTEMPFGTYSVTMDWEDKRHVFESIEITRDSADTVVFRPIEIKAADTFYRGRVVHGITGKPIARAIVMRRPWPPHAQNYTEPDAEYTERLPYVGPEIDPTNELFGAMEEQMDLRITRTGPDGVFEITMPGEASQMSRETIVAVKQDFLGAERTLSYMVRDLNDPLSRLEQRDFTVSADGHVTLPDMKLFPAGTIIIEPRVPDDPPGFKARIRFQFFTNPDDSAAWLRDLRASPIQSRGGSVYAKRNLCPNEAQRIYIPANVDVTVELHPRRKEQLSLVTLGGIRLAQGEILNLCRIDFRPMIDVTVKVMRAGNASKALP